MRIAWFTPFSHTSAIGRFSQAVTNELAKHVTVDLWTDSSDDLLPTALRVFQHGAEAVIEEWSPSENYDFVIHNDGDQPGFHHIDFGFSGKRTTIVVCSDFLINRFIAGYHQLAVDILSETLDPNRFHGSGDAVRVGGGQQSARMRSELLLNTPAADYALRLLRFLEEVRTVKPALEALHRTARTLAQLGIESDTEIVCTIAARSANMFCRFADEAPWNNPK